MASGTLTDQDRQSALRRILAAAEKLLARVTAPAAKTAAYALTAAALWEIAGGDPAALGPLAPFVTMLSGDFLANLIERVAHGDEAALDPAQLQAAVEAALASHGLGGVLTEGEFYHAFRILMARQDDRDAHFAAEFAELKAMVARLQPPPPTVPLQRPQRPEHFTGRDAELQAVLDHLAPGRAVSLVGPGGIGKTAIAIETAWALAPGADPPAAYPDGIIFHSFYNQPEIARAAAHIIQSLLPNADDLSLAALGRILARRRLLLILDGAEDADDLHTLLQHTGPSALLISTRDQRHAPGHVIPVPLLDIEKAVGLLRDWSGDFLAAADLQLQLEHIADLLGRLPLALRLVGSYLAVQREPLAAYIPWLEEHPIEALNPYDADHRQDNVDRLLERSLAQVSDDACALLSAAGVHALDPFNPDLVADALDLDPRARRRALGDLLKYSLLTRDPAGRVAVTHALIHTYARVKLPPDDETLHRLVEAYADRFDAESAQGAEGLHRLDPDRPHALRLLTHTQARDLHPDTRRLAGALNDYLDLRGYALDRVTALQAGLATARALADRRQEGAWLGNLGIAYKNLGQVTKAIGYHQQALAISREVGDRCGEGTHLGNLGVAHDSLGQVAAAIGYYEQALVISREIGDRRGESIHLGNLGLAHWILGQVAEAIAHYEQSLVIALEIGDLQREAKSLDDLGLAYARLGQAKKAIDHHKQALTIAREIGDRRCESNCLGHLGQAHANQGQAAEAISYYDQALRIARQIMDRRIEESVLGDLGLAYWSLGQVTKAIRYYRQALAIAREIGDRRGEANSLDDLGLAYAGLGQAMKAIDYFEKALSISRGIGHRHGEGNRLSNLGNAYADLGQVAKTISYCEQALAIYREIGDRRGEGNCLGSLGSAYHRQGWIMQAIEYHKQALVISQEIGDRRGEGADLCNLGLSYATLGQVAKAIEYYQQALTIARQIADRRMEGSILGNLGLAYATLGRMADAIDRWQQSLKIFEEIKSPRAQEMHSLLQKLADKQDKPTDP
jgi:tetratricopeptide (TPR) repeat protein